MWGRPKANIATRGLKPKYVIGVDPALRNVGISVFDNTGANLLSTCIKTRTGWPDHRSVDYIIEEFFEAVEPFLVHNSSGASLTAIYLEHILFGQVGKATARAEAIGVLKWNLRQDRHHCFGVVPNAVNSFLAGKFNLHYPGGRGDGLSRTQRSKRIKELTMEALHHHCNFYTDDDNIADAYAIGLLGVAHSIEKLQLSVTPLYKIL